MNLAGTYIKYLGNKIEMELEKEVLSLLPRGDIAYLDVGCWDGEKTVKRALTIGTTNIAGIEVEKISAEKAKKKGIKMYRADLNKKWPMEKNAFDCISATEVIEHLVDVDNFLSEIKRVLKPGGTVVISTENLASYHNIFALLLGTQPYTGPYLSRKFPIGHRPNALYYKGNNNEMYPHLSVMTTKSLVELLNRYGFTVKKVLGVGFHPYLPMISQLLAKVDKYHPVHCVVLAKLQKK